MVLFPFFLCEVKEKDLHVTFRFVYPPFFLLPPKNKEYVLAGYCNPITVHIALINPVSSMHGFFFPITTMCTVFLNQLAICKCELGFELGETVNKSSYRSGRREDLELGASGLQAIRSR